MVCFDLLPRSLICCRILTDSIEKKTEPISAQPTLLRDSTVARAKTAVPAILQPTDNSKDEWHQNIQVDPSDQFFFAGSTKIRQTVAPNTSAFAIGTGLKASTEFL